MKRRRHLVAAGLALLVVPAKGITQASRTPPRIGWIAYADPGRTINDFRDGLRRLGYVGATEVPIETRLATRGHSDVPAIVEELLQMQVPLIVTQGPAAPTVRRIVDGRIPLVFAFSGDPVEAGLVQSLARPGGNTTGMSFLALDLVGKRLELMKEISPKVRRVAILANPQHPGEKAERRESLIAAEKLGLQVAYVEFSQAQGFEAALDSVRRQHCDGLVVFPDAGMLTRAPRIAEFALQERLLCVSGWADFARAGCIASYGPNLDEGYRRLAHYADRILRGTPASSLPVELPTRLSMLVNVKTARALGLTIPQSVLLRADEVIE
jgi:putative ABC transport system substrate-binding protein